MYLLQVPPTRDAELQVRTPQLVELGSLLYPKPGFPSIFPLLLSLRPTIPLLPPCHIHLILPPLASSALSRKRIFVSSQTLSPLVSFLFDSRFSFEIPSQVLTLESRYLPLSCLPAHPLPLTTISASSPPYPSCCLPAGSALLRHRRHIDILLSAHPVAAGSEFHRRPSRSTLCFAIWPTFVVYHHAASQHRYVGAWHPTPSHRPRLRPRPPLILSACAT